MQFRERLGLPPSKLAQEHRALSTELVTTRNEAYQYVQESMMVALQLAMEDKGWLRQDGYNRDEWGKNLTLQAIQNAGVNGMALIQANPIMARAASAKVGYIMGNGVRVGGNTAIDNLIEKAVNRQTLFSRDAREDLILQKAAIGNILVLITGDSSEIIPFEEIRGAVYSARNKNIIEFFYRVWKEVYTDPATNNRVEVEQKMFYPNSTYDTGGAALPGKIGDIDVYTQGTVLHIAGKKYGGAWGVPDLLAGIFYATEHKELVEAGDAIYRAQSQYAVTYKAKTRKAFENMAAMVAAPPGVDPRTGQPAEYGGSAVFGQDIEMQLMGKIGAGIDFKLFDPIAALAVSGFSVPMDVALGREEATEKAIPFTTLNAMKLEQEFWTEAYTAALELFGVKRSKVSVFWPKINPDPTHRQVQSIVGAAKTKTISPEETRGLFKDTFGVDWPDKVPDPAAWDKFGEQTLAPGAVEGNGKPITPGQGQTGQLGKLADGDHGLRDEGLQEHTQK